MNNGTVSMALTSGKITVPRGMPLFRHHVDYLGMDSEEIWFIHVLNQMMHSDHEQETLHQQVHQCPASSKNLHRHRQKMRLSMLTLRPTMRVRSFRPMLRDRTTGLSRGMLIIPDIETKLNIRYRTFALMFKVLFSVGVLSIPGVFAYVGAVPGALLVIGWGSFNTYAAFLLGSFKLRHANIHVSRLPGEPENNLIPGSTRHGFRSGWCLVSRVDWSSLHPWVCRTESHNQHGLTISYVLIAGSGYIGMATAFNALSNHGTCTVVFTFISFIMSTALALFPKLSQIGVAGMYSLMSDGFGLILAWIGVITLFASIMTLVVAVGVQDRPALAPAGEFDLGFYAIGSPTFLTGMSACLIIFVSSSGTSAFIPM